MGITGVVLALCGALLSFGSASAGTGAGTVPNNCRFPGEVTAVVPVEFVANFPETVSPGMPIQPAGAVLTVVLAEPTVTALRDAGVQEVRGAVEARLGVRQGGGGQDIPIGPLELPVVTLPGSGELRIPVRAEVPPVSVPVPGPATFELVTAGLALTDVTCTPEPGQDNQLFTVTVTGPPARNTGEVPGGVSVNALPDTVRAAATPLKYSPLRVFVDAKATMRKLNSDLAFPQGRFEGGVVLSVPPGGDPADRGKLNGTLALPPANGRFIAFSFMPTTALATLEQPEPATGMMKDKLIDLTIKQVIRLRDVRVDGVPLDVGADCRTVEPMSATLRGSLPLKVGEKGEFVSTFDLPPFTGCGVTEDLDPLLTGLVSGPGNTLYTTLTMECVATCKPK
ncbi:DUF6801 domain-containing protein [Amycolatopsis nigrescens]|uniref:DUF6801 domain-containing protein n=1 Tax=Amycolatopsis nigrescens TaxID=381445 RepID=UPI0012FB394A|nr:DUF6801 domain-containing protein [Amycolatopsis nigrescens]